MGIIIALVICLGSGAVVWLTAHDDTELAGQAIVTASSTGVGFSARDVVTSGSTAEPGAGWQSDQETSGAWIELHWPSAHILRQVVVVRNPLQESGVTEGFLTFGDGSYLQISLSQTSRITFIPFSPRSVDRFRFTASAVSAGARSVAIAEILVTAAPTTDDVVVDDMADGNAAVTAKTTVSPQVGASDPHLLQDGTGAPGSVGSGADWTTSRPSGSVIELQWVKPRELSSIQVVGSVSSTTTTLSSATITFSDGTELPVGAVLADPDHPTTVSFMPRAATSVRLTINSVQGSGTLALGELRAYQRGATPVRASSGTHSDRLTSANVSCGAPSAGGEASGLLVTCPMTSAVVDGRVEFQLAAPAGYTTVTASVWPANGALPAGAAVEATLDPSGAASLTVDITTAPPGPLTVEFAATGPTQKLSEVFFQLYRSGDESSGDVGPSAVAAGRTLAYADEFDQPVSLSRTGAGADYATAKPTWDGAQDFGDAIFADNGDEFGNMQVVDSKYLRIDVKPVDAEADPQRWGRTHVGGLLASGRQGGSGFSAQYGYFETRILAPAAPGTWPAFWMLPSDNLIAATPVVAEIDAVELYGHEPQGSCHNTHQFEDGKDGGIALCGQRFPTERAALAWHTFGASVTPAEVVFYIDGQVVGTSPQVRGGGAPMFFLINLALGGGWPLNLQGVQDRASLYVDYVRVYV